jgi:mannose-6-phosphate isomerase-like protein (cupin superfamily)
MHLPLAAGWNTGDNGFDMTSTPQQTFACENDQHNRQVVPGMRNGCGSVTIRRFEFAGATLPARFVVYELLPGASEGVHAHYADNRNGTGTFEEFYYILAGRGMMTVGQHIFPVGPGDYIHVPLGLERGIANVDELEALKVHLTFIGDY